MGKLYHNNIPDSFGFKQVFRLKEHDLTYYLDTNAKDQVEGLYFTWDGDEETAQEFSLFTKSVEGLNFGELPKSDVPGLHAPALFYRLLIDKVRRGGPLYPYAKNRDPLKLICRCFGVYEEDIHELFGTGEEVKTIKELGERLQAGIGCGSCHHDLKAILSALVSAPVAIPDDEKPELPLWKKLDSDSLARLAFQDVKDLKESSGVEASLVGIRPDGILVKISKSSGSVEDSKKVIREKIEASLGKGLEINFT